MNSAASAEAIKTDKRTRPFASMAVWGGAAGPQECLRASGGEGWGGGRRPPESGAGSPPGISTGSGGTPQNQAGSGGSGVRRLPRNLSGVSAEGVSGGRQLPRNLPGGPGGGRPPESRGRGLGDRGAEGPRNQGGGVWGTAAPRGDPYPLRRFFRQKLDPCLRRPPKPHGFSKNQLTEGNPPEQATGETPRLFPASAPESAGLLRTQTSSPQPTRPNEHSRLRGGLKNKKKDWKTAVGDGSPNGERQASALVVHGSVG